MPHCIIEYSKELEAQIEPSKLIKLVHQGAVTSKLFDESHIKTRALAYTYYQTGISGNAFIHVTAKILSGRTQAQKADLSKSILSQFEKVALSSVTITVQICDIETESYTKMFL